MKQFFLLIIIILCSFDVVAKPAITNSLNFVGYYETWSEPWVSDPAQSPLVKLPKYVNIVILSFMKPDGVYRSGSLELNESGIQFPYDGNTFKKVLDKFRENHPNVKVLVAIGGATYNNWQNLNVNAIVNLVKDFKLDGIDIDYEAFPNCARGVDGHVHCQSDNELIKIIKTFRNALPRPYWISTAGWSTGAYGEDQWQNASPQGGYTGMFLAPIRAAGDQLDMINVMSYDAGNKRTTGYDPVEAMLAYQHYFKGKMVMGVEVSPEAWGGNVSSLLDVENLGKAVIQHQAQGMMLWSLQKKPNGTPTPQNPDANMISKTICLTLGLSGC